MLLNEIFAKDFDLSESGKKILVLIYLAGKDGLNMQSMLAREKSPRNLASEKDELLSLGIIEPTDREDFFVITNAGIETMKRAALIDNNGELIVAHTKKYLPKPEEPDEPKGPMAPDQN